MKLNQSQKSAGFLVKLANMISLGALGVILLVGLVIILLVYPAQQFLPRITTSEPAQPVAPATALPPVPATVKMWRPPDLASLPATTDSEQIRYGRELVAHTATYLGPEGKVLQISNGMNCQNCHLDAGTKAFGNNYSLVASTYPKFRARSGTTEDITKRVNDCFERSLNGKPLAADSKEMQAIVAYIKFLGKDVKPGEKVKGAGLLEVAMLDRAASPRNGKVIYAQKCQSCHGPEGEGNKPFTAKEYAFPPLWGKNSYNEGAGLYRISNFTRYVKANMPLGASHDRPLLTDEEAWDVAAFVNSQPRPNKDLSQDWPKIEGKPFDHPFGPYADSFSEVQHKYGPYQPIIAAKNKEK